MPASAPESAARLGAIKLLHTAVWAFFAGCILAVFPAAHTGRFRLAGGLMAVVACEVLVLAFNRLRCPLTDLAARYTPDREPNFDIFLPAWLARHNKALFGSLYAAGIAYSLLRWLG